MVAGAVESVVAVTPSERIKTALLVSLSMERRDVILTNQNRRRETSKPL